MSLNVQYRNYCQKCSYSKWWSALKLLCLYIISYNCQNTGLLDVLTEVLQAFVLLFTVVNYLRNRRSNKKSGSSSWAVSHCNTSCSIEKHSMDFVYQAPLVCRAPLRNTNLRIGRTDAARGWTLMANARGSFARPPTSLSRDPRLHPCWHSSHSLPAPPALTTLQQAEASWHIDALPMCLPSAFTKGCLRQPTASLSPTLGLTCPLGQAWVCTWGMQELIRSWNSHSTATDTLQDFPSLQM